MRAAVGQHRLGAPGGDSREEMQGTQRLKEEAHITKATGAQVAVWRPVCRAYATATVFRGSQPHPAGSLCLSYSPALPGDRAGGVDGGARGEYVW